MGFLSNLFNQQRQMQSLVDSVSAEVTSRVAAQLQREFNALGEVEGATQQVVELTKQIAKLNAEKEGITEGFARKEREIEHKTGLLRQEIEGEQKLAAKDFELRVQEAKLVAREAGLVERQKAFEDKMTFIEKRFTDEVGYLKEMVKEMSERLPTAAVFGTKEM